jgi:hypothetical protein
LAIRLKMRVSSSLSLATKLHEESF